MLHCPDSGCNKEDKKHLLNSFLCEGLPVPHADIYVGILSLVLESCCQSCCLLVGDPSERRAPANFFIAF